MIIDEQTLEEVAGFHGHLCPGLTMGVQAAQLALREIGANSREQEVIAVVETDMCGVDAVQFLTGCTFGKGNLMHRDWGKHAFSFYRSDGQAIRVVARPDGWARDPEHAALRAKISAGEASDEDRARFRELHESQARHVLEYQPEDLYEVTRFVADPPPRDRVHASAVCDGCGEAAKQTRIRVHEDQQLCVPCFEAVTLLGDVADGQGNLLDPASTGA